MMFQKAIVRQPGRSLVRGLSTAGLGLPDFPKAQAQHRLYVSALEACGLEVTRLEADETHPDSTFVEDTAVLTPHCAVITNPGAPSRKGEIDDIERELKKEFQSLERIHDPGTLDGGDVLCIEGDYYIGLSERTNSEGARQLIDILGRYDLCGSTLPVRAALHLKSSVAYLGDGVLAACGELLAAEAFQAFQILEIPRQESYAANCLAVNRTVLVPAGFPVTAAMVEEAGFSIQLVEVSEFQKLDGGLSCLSLRW